MPGVDLSTDPLLVSAPVHEGYKVLGGVVLYQKLGQGGMGAVYRGRHLRLNVDVAVKVMATPSGLVPDQAESFVRRFVREAQTAAQIDHSNLVRVFDVDWQHGVYFLVMQFVDGESAGDRLKRKGRLAEQEAVEICLGGARGLAAAHRKGIVHRDVKPDNIMIDREGSVRVADLGLAKAFSAEDGAETSIVTQTHQAMGTPSYMAIEQFVSAKDVGPPADVWSLGVTLHQLLTDSLPWTGTNVLELMNRIQNDPPRDTKELRPDLSDGVCGIIARTLEKNPKERYADCGEMADALSGHLEDLGAPPAAALADAEAGSSKMALVAMPPPASNTMTLIGRSVLRPSERELPVSKIRRLVIGGRALPRWALPVGLALAGVLLMGVVLWAAVGGEPEEAPQIDKSAVEADTVEAEAERFLQRLVALADEGDIDQAARLIGEAGARYDTTPAGPRIARLADTIATKIAARKRQEEEERERRRRREEKRLAALVDEADRAERAGDLDEALRQAKLALAIRDRPEVRERVGRLERAVGAELLVELGMGFERAGELEKAKDAYARAIPDAIGEAKRKARERLAEVERRIRLEDTVARITRKAEAGEWRDAWEGVNEARASGLKDARLDGFARQAAEALAPPKMLTGPLGIELVFIPGGKFTMGTDDEPEEGPAHEVVVSSFYVGRFEVTKAQFDAFRREVGGASDVKPAEGPEPVVGVSWEEARQFCRYLSSIDRTTSAATGAARAAYRLPTEAEWEFAARGPEGRTYPWGDEAPTPMHANLAGDADGFEKLAPVGSFPAGATPGGAGHEPIFDLVGNAAEWCLDWYGPYASSPQTDPKGASVGIRRVLRGSAFAYDANRWSRATTRVVGRPEARKDTVGFRVVRELTEEEAMFERATFRGAARGEQ